MRFGHLLEAERAIELERGPVGGGGADQDGAIACERQRVTRGRARPIPRRMHCGETTSRVITTSAATSSSPSTADHRTLLVGYPDRFVAKVVDCSCCGGSAATPINRASTA